MIIVHVFDDVEHVFEIEDPPEESSDDASTD